MSNIQVISTGYVPRPLQLYLHQHLKRFNVVVCHRRFGKTVFSLNEMIDRGLRNDLKNPQYAYIAPTYGQAKRIAWDYLKEFTKMLPGVTVNEAELRVEIPRYDRGDKVRYMLLGAENPGTIRGIYLDGVLLDEFAEMDPTIWSQVVRPALSDRIGWVIFIGTPKGQNHFYDVFKLASKDDTWFSSMYRASETGIIPGTELELAKQTMTPEEYEQEYECSFSAALIGAYYGKQIEAAEKDKRITKVPYDKAALVDTYWDLGVDDSTVIWFCQTVGRELHLIDYVEENGRGLDWYAKILREKPYAYGDHFLPHDAAARELGVSGAKTREETFTELVRKRPVITPRQSLEDGINAVRMILDRCWFDADKCEKGLAALKNYERKWDSKKKTFLQTPLHNWASHGADAFRILALNTKDPRRYDNLRKLPTRVNNKYDIFGR